MKKRTLKILSLCLVFFSFEQTAADVLSPQPVPQTLQQNYGNLPSCAPYAPAFQVYIDGLKAYAKTDLAQDKAHQDYYQAQIDYFEALKAACASGKKPSQILPISFNTLVELWALMESSNPMDTDRIETLAKAHQYWPTSQPPQEPLSSADIRMQQRFLERFFLEEYLTHILQKYMPLNMFALRQNSLRYILFRLSWRQKAGPHGLSSTVFPKIQAQETEIFKKGTKAFKALTEVSLDIPDHLPPPGPAAIPDPAHIQINFPSATV